MPDPKSIKRSYGVLFVLIALVLVSVAAPVAAEPIPAPPADLRGEVEDGMVRLYWNGTGDAYHVYRNGAYIATTREAQFMDSPAQHEVELLAYVVTAIQNGTESLPSLPWTPGPLDDLMPPECALINSSSNLSEPPFIFWNFNDQCIDAWEWYINSFLCNPPDGCSEEDGS